MGQRVPLVLAVRGDLDTSAPITDRPLGGLQRALDLHPRRWGPKDGCQSFARVWSGPGTASLYDEFDLNTGASTFGTGLSYEDQFRDLGTKFTLDLWFRLTTTAYAAGKDKIGLYKFVVNASGVIEVAIAGPAHATPGRILVYIVTNPTRTTADTPVSFVGSTAITVGSTQADKHHVRLVRDGANAYLYLNGVIDATETTLVATSQIFSTLGTTAAVVGLGNLYIGTDPNVTLNGQIFGAWLRDGAFTSAPIEAVMPCAPHAKNVHHAYLGRDCSTSGTPHFFDAGRFAAHARVSGIGYAPNPANDDTAPAPARVQGVTSWNTRSNRTATAVVCGGLLSVSGVT